MIALNQVPDVALIRIARSICQSEGLTLEHSLGQGSFKQAYLVMDKSGNQYALKIIQDPNPSPRILREIQSLKRCNHLSIAKLINLGTHAIGGVEYQYLIEEYLSGGTLSSLINSLGGLDESSIVSLAKLLADALSHLQTLRLVHRDIKPDNILFRDDISTPVLVDFGCVRDLSASSLTQTWALRGPGTPYFSSPEQLNNQKPLIDWRSDQFSLGVSLFYAQFRAHPYQHPDEPVFSPETVDRVAQRGERRSDLMQLIGNTPLYPIDKMTTQWPVLRYRYPEDLAEAWVNN